MVLEFFFFGACAGVLCGMAPFIVARNKGKPDLALTALIICAISGAMLGLLLAVPAALIMLAVAMSSNDSR